MCNNNSVSCKLLSLLLLCEEVTAQKAEGVLSLRLTKSKEMAMVVESGRVKSTGCVWGSSYVCMLVNPVVNRVYIIFYY
jgi:hypothetical protein